MLLETIKSLVSRSKKRKELALTTSLLPNPNKSATHISDPPQPTVSTRTENALTPSTRPPDNGQGQPPPNAPDLGFFQYAHHFIINNPTMLTQVINSGGTVLQHLAQKRIVGAEVDSSARDPPPKCHPETRKGLRGHIVAWVINGSRHWRMLWVMGPAGTGKSAVAQTIAEGMKASGHLGAALFFSRLNHRDDPDGVIPTIVHQLVLKCPEYKRIITECFAGDPTILEKNRRTQFKELIIDPFQTIMRRNPQIIQQPLLIIIDGLDECKSKEAQCEFIELISDHVRGVDEFPLLWMICSRPEWHLKGMLSQPDFEVTCKREELLIDDVEAQQDVARVLEDGFKDIRRVYQDRLEVGWPPQVHLRQISVTSSGLFAFASTIVKFVGDKYHNDPEVRLELCIRFLGGLGSPGAVNPLHALDLIYRQILSDVPKDTLSTTLRILGVSILYSGTELSVQQLANFLLLDRSTFYRSLQHLHSVADIPPMKDAHQEPLHFYHASFGDYLVNPHRSDSFSINKAAVHYDVAVHSLKWHGGSLRTAEDETVVHSASFPKLEWARPTHKQVIFAAVKDFSWRMGWKACSRISDTNAGRIVTELDSFDFRGMSRVPPGFSDFLAWLYRLGDRKNSLIQLIEQNDQENTGAIFVEHHLSDSVDEFMLAFGLSGDTAHDGHLYLQLGKGDRTRNIILEVQFDFLSEESRADSVLEDFPFGPPSPIADRPLLPMEDFPFFPPSPIVDHSQLQNTSQ